MKKNTKYTVREEIQILKSTSLLLVAMLEEAGGSKEWAESIRGKLKDIGCLKYAIAVEEKYLEEEPVADWLK